MKQWEEVDVIFWDCDGVIWFYDVEEEKILARDLKIPFSEEFKVQFYQMLKEFERQFERNRVSCSKIEKMIQKTMPILEVYQMSAGKFLREWSRMKKRSIIPNPEAKVIMKQMKERGYRNEVLTDWLEQAQIPSLKACEVYSYLDRIHTINNQFLKKNPSSVKRVIQSGMEKHYVIIGDSLKDDIVFAKNAGIASIWYNPQKRENTTLFKPTWEVQSLLEITDILL